MRVKAGSRPRTLEPPCNESVNENVFAEKMSECAS